MGLCTLGWAGLPFAVYVLQKQNTNCQTCVSSYYRPKVFSKDMKTVLWQHRKTISHPAPSIRWKQSLVGSCCLFTLALSEMIIIGQKWACFSDCSFSSLLALWDFLFISKETAASPVSVQRNCNCLNWEPYLNPEMKWKFGICFSISMCW